MPVTDPWFRRMTATKFYCLSVKSKKQSPLKFGKLIPAHSYDLQELRFWWVRPQKVVSYWPIDDKEVANDDVMKVANC